MRSHGYFCAEIPGPSLISGRLIDSGLLIASKYPFTHYDWITYTRGSGVDEIVAKGCLYVKLRITNAQKQEIPLHLFNTHMQAGYDKGRELHEANRLHQMDELRNFIALKTKLDNDPILVVGDFNVNGRVGPKDGSESEAYRDLRRRAFPEGYQVRDFRMCI